jgi:hypothetical protein
MNMKKEQQKRATFEDVCNAQDKLQYFLDDHIDNNKVIDVKKRLYFIKLFRLATLGLGCEFTFTVTSDTGSYSMGHVAHAAYWLSYRDDADNVVIGGGVFTIGECWLHLRDYCFQIFPLAQQMSIKISKEQTYMGPSTPALV